MLASVDLFVSTVDPLKEPPLVTANTVLSILSVDYPVDKVSCYVSDDGASMLTFESLSETSEFARKWVPFCKKFSIEPRAPEVYFSQKIDYLKDKFQPTFVKERRAMKVSKVCPQIHIGISNFISVEQVPVLNALKLHDVCRENMKNSRCASIDWLQRPLKCLRKDGQCKTVRLGLVTIPETILV